ncbi:26S proteasome regulatory complex, non-ATPase subcomplex, Rpn2/Psmd1 subunit [Actinidia rufa]|uniref:26S proteasome regulatory complex, non-ATPase subcomplex, Rpn2/Psmd1 subunit n=1 Tax=Actinidia rufa TaxID=165716 RepID=A0A7J0FUN9_9ERIC|nr:26S proteasome regulatory complex, non-ATPase subcomplex, Rpn2/Psmd1 subunit [Actinidia rufa]
MSGKGIDEYACLKSKIAESSDEGAKMDPPLEVIVEKMMDKCILDGYEQAIGMAIECRRLDKLEEAINLREYGCEVLCLLVKVHQKLPSPDYLSICQCLMFLVELEGVASILEKLLRSENKDDALLAFQIAFGLVENERQAFLLNVKTCFLGQSLNHRNLHSKDLLHQSLVKDGNATASEDVQMIEGSQVSNQDVQEADPNEATYAERFTVRLHNEGLQLCI